MNAPIADGLHLAAAQYDAGLVALGDNVVEGRGTVLRDELLRSRGDPGRAHGRMLLHTSRPRLSCTVGREKYPRDQSPFAEPPSSSIGPHSPSEAGGASKGGGPASKE